MTTTEHSDEVWYEGNCHCAAIRFRAKLPPLETLQIMNCNCSICIKNGYLNVYPKRKDVEIQSGEDILKSYYFGNKKFAHKFCPNCGSSLFVDPDMESNDKMVVNVSLPLATHYVPPC